jgi:ADP-heptose:LPS heptosyltransferase
MKSFTDLTKGFVNYPELVFDAFLTYLAKIYKNIDFKNKTDRKSVLLKTFGVIGDYVLLTASFEGYRVLFKDYVIVLLVREEVRDFAIRNPFVDKLIFVDYWAMRKNPFKKIKLWFMLLRYDFKVAINLDYSSLYEKRDKTILSWSLADKKIAHESLDYRSKRDYTFYDIIISQSKEWMFEIDRNNEMLRQLGLHSFKNSITKIYDLDHYQLRTNIRQLLPKDNYYVVCPGSGSKKSSKCWPTEKYASLMHKLDKLGYVAVLCGSGKEIKIAKDIIQKSSLLKVIDLTGKTTLMDLAYVLKSARMLISNDSSAAHVANAVGTTAIVILGGAEYGRFFPYPDQQYIHPVIKKGMDCFYCNWICKYDTYKCIKDIPIEEVEAEIWKVLLESRKEL